MLDDKRYSQYFSALLFAIVTLSSILSGANGLGTSSHQFSQAHVELAIDQRSIFNESDVHLSNIDLPSLICSPLGYLSSNIFNVQYLIIYEQQIAVKYSSISDKFNYYNLLSHTTGLIKTPNSSDDPANS